MDIDFIILIVLKLVFKDHDIQKKSKLSIYYESLKNQIKKKIKRLTIKKRFKSEI